MLIGIDIKIRLSTRHRGFAASLNLAEPKDSHTALRYNICAHALEQHIRQNIFRNAQLHRFLLEFSSNNWLQVFFLFFLFWFAENQRERSSEVCYYLFCLGFQCEKEWNYVTNRVSCNKSMKQKSKRENLLAEKRYVPFLCFGYFGLFGFKKKIHLNQFKLQHIHISMK